MKKLFLVLIAVALVGSFAFAEVTGVDAPTISGSVTTTFGYDLDSEDVGFNNSTSVNVAIPLASGSDTHMGSGAAYGEISITDVDLSIDEDDGVELSSDLSVSAKIVVGAIEIGLNDPSFSFNNVDQDDDDDINMLDLNEDGISVGYVSDMATVKFMVASSSDGYQDDSDDDISAADTTTSWTDSNDDDAATDDFTDDAENTFAFGAVANVTAGPAVVDIQFGFLADMYMGFGATAVLTAGPATVTVPFDYVSDLANEESGMELDPSVSVMLDGVGTIAANFFFGSYADVAAIAGDQEMTFGLTFTEGFSEELTMSVEAEVSGLASEDDMGWAVDVDTAYAMGVAAPYVNFGYGSDEEFDLQIGSTLAVIDNATVTLDYTNEGLTVAKESGRVTLAVGVTY
ncbi:MAG: hypothetical protein JEY99_12270 [Spirochaetales bacterium]|nr:hypothetical protein [Spirochaetales bacterium]